MNKFKRTQTLFTGGDVRISSGNARDGFFPQQTVTIIRAIPDHGDEEDRFEIELRNAGRAIVDGCDLHPHPDAPATNVEFITHLMTAHPNPLVQGFIPEAIAKYAEFCLQDEAKYREQAGDNPLINPTAWLGIAKELLDEINANYKGR